MQVPTAVVATALAIPGGHASAIRTARANDGPALLATMVQVTDWPATTELGDAVLTIVRSAPVVTATDADVAFVGRIRIDRGTAHRRCIRNVGNQDIRWNGGDNRQ